MYRTHAAADTCICVSYACLGFRPAAGADADDFAAGLDIEAPARGSRDPSGQLQTTDTPPKNDAVRTAAGRGLHIPALAWRAERAWHAAFESRGEGSL